MVGFPNYNLVPGIADEVLFSFASVCLLKPKRLSTKINTGDKSATKSTLWPICHRFYRQIGDNLTIYESRDDPVTSDVISIQWQSKM